MNTLKAELKQSIQIKLQMSALSKAHKEYTFAIVE